MSIKSFACRDTEALVGLEVVARFANIINDQFRLCFRWTGADAEDVEIVDYH